MANGKGTAAGDANEQPTVSVIIPTYNRRDSVMASIDSVLRQDWPALEVVVVDDGSSDGSAAALRVRYAADLAAGRVQVIEQQNQGPAVARNTGLTASRGSLLAVLDSDDVLADGSIRARAEVMVRHPEASGTYAWHCRYKDRAEQPADRPCPPFASKRDLLAAYLHKPWFDHFDILFRRSLLPADGQVYFGRIFEDFTMILRLLCQGEWVPCSKVAVWTRFTQSGPTLRRHHQKLLDQGMNPAEQLLSQPGVRAALGDLESDVLSHFYENMANAAWHVGNYPLFRTLYWKALQASRNKRRILKQTGRLLASIVRKPAKQAA